MKIRRDKFKLLLIFLLLISYETYSQYGLDAGLVSRMAVGSRAISLGGAYRSVAEGGSGMYWNPAGLGQLGEVEIVSSLYRYPSEERGGSKVEVEGMYGILGMDREHIHLSFAGNIAGIGGIGIGWSRFGVKSIEGRDILGNMTGEFKDSENNIVLGIGRRIGKVDLGLNLRYIYHSLYDRTGTGIGIDLGVITEVIEGLRVGVVGKNIGSKVSWNTESGISESVGMEIGGGVSYDGKNKLPILISCDVNKIGKEQVQIRFGTEYRIYEKIGLRMGYDGNGMVYGMGGKMQSGDLLIGIDYAAVKDLLESSFVHYITFNFKF